MGGCKHAIDNEGPRYSRAAETTATIINLHVQSDDPPAIKYAKILYLVLDAMYEAEREIAQMQDVIFIK